jgi:hypothetical protein
MTIHFAKEVLSDTLVAIIDLSHDCESQLEHLSFPLCHGNDILNGRLWIYLAQENQEIRTCSQSGRVSKNAMLDHVSQ